MSRTAPPIPWHALTLDPRPLALGPSAEVYRARLDDRPVVVKITDDPAEAAALARVAARARAPLPVPRLIGTTLTPTGRPALVREHIDGLPLSTLIERALIRRRWQGGRRWNAPTRALTAALLDAVSALHDAGLAHNDLKPDDLFVTVDAAGTWRVTLIDLGLAAPPGRGGPGGTVAYAAPERLDGTPGTVRSDLWSLGAIVYELLAGTRAYPSDHPVDARLERRHPIARSPRDAAQRAWRELPPEVQSALAAALDPDPRHRPRSVAALKKALGLAALSPTPRTAPQPSPPAPAATSGLRSAARAHHRVPLLVTAAAATALALVLALGPVATALGLAGPPTTSDPAACAAMHRRAAALCAGMSGEAACRAALTATSDCASRAALLGACEASP